MSFPLLLVKLPHHQQLECYSTSQFQPGDVVWAKAPQLPGWPGLVINHSQWKRNRLQPAPDGKVSQLALGVSISRAIFEDCVSVNTSLLHYITFDL